MLGFGFLGGGGPIGVTAVVVVEQEVRASSAGFGDGGGMSVTVEASGSASGVVMFSERISFAQGTVFTVLADREQDAAVWRVGSNIFWACSRKAKGVGLLF